MFTSPALTPFLHSLSRVEAMHAGGVKITQPRLVPVFQIYGFGDFASMNPQINGRQSGILEKLQILKPVKPSLKTPPPSIRQPQASYLIQQNLSFSLSLPWISCDESYEIMCIKRPT